MLSADERSMLDRLLENVDVGGQAFKDMIIKKVARTMAIIRTDHRPDLEEEVLLGIIRGYLTRNPREFFPNPPLNVVRLGAWTNTQLKNDLARIAHAQLICCLSALIRRNSPSFKEMAEASLEIFEAGNTLDEEKITNQEQGSLICLGSVVAGFCLAFTQIYLLLIAPAAVCVCCGGRKCLKGDSSAVDAAMERYKLAKQTAINSLEQPRNEEKVDSATVGLLEHKPDSLQVVVERTHHSDSIGLQDGLYAIFASQQADREEPSVELMLPQEQPDLPGHIPVFSA